jgi:hypothetical protein
MAIYFTGYDLEAYILEAVHSLNDTAYKERFSIDDIPNRHIRLVFEAAENFGESVKKGLYNGIIEFPNALRNPEKSSKFRHVDHENAANKFMELEAPIYYYNYMSDYHEETEIIEAISELFVNKNIQRRFDDYVANFCREDWEIMADRINLAARSVSREF